jgi:hypothetical protein
MSLRNKKGRYITGQYLFVLLIDVNRNKPLISLENVSITITKLLIYE